MATWCVCFDWPQDLPALEALDKACVFPSFNCRYSTPLIRAIVNEDSRMVEALLRLGANPNLGGNWTYDAGTPLQCAALVASPIIVRHLLEAGADVDGSVVDVLLKNHPRKSCRRLAAIADLLLPRCESFQLRLAFRKSCTCPQPCGLVSAVFEAFEARWLAAKSLRRTWVTAAVVSQCIN